MQSREYSMRGSRTASRCCLSAWNPAQSPKSRSTPFAARACSMSGSVRRSRLRAASAPRSTTLPESAVSGVFAFALSSSGPIAYSAAIRSPVTASRCSRSPALSSVTSSARSRGATDLDVEHLLRGQIGSLASKIRKQLRCNDLTGMERLLGTRSRVKAPRWTRPALDAQIVSVAWRPLSHACRCPCPAGRSGRRTGSATEDVRTPTSCGACCRPGSAPTPGSCCRRGSTPAAALERARQFDLIKELLTANTLGTS